MIILRAHHLLCMQGFQGYGYSEKFVENFGVVIAHLKKHSQTKIKIIADVDVICEHCPHNIESICQLTATSQQKLKTFDVNVLKTLGISDGIILEFTEVLELLSKTFTTKALKKEICGDCLWQDKCLWLIS